MKVFEAKYRGICAVCDETIYPGDDVGYEDDELIHAGCAGNVPVNLDDAPAAPGVIVRAVKRRRTTPDNICPVCSLDHAGECM